MQNKEASLQQYFALKISTISYSSYLFFRPFGAIAAAVDKRKFRLKRLLDQRRFPEE